MSARGSSLAKLVKLGAAALQPTKADNGVWRKAAVSARSAARLRHAALLENRPWPYEEPREPSRVYDQPLKGHKADLGAPLRQAKVAAGLAKQGELQAARAKAKEPKTGPEAAYEADTLTKKEKRIKARTTQGAK